MQTPLGVLLGRLAQSAPGFPAVTCDGVTISRAELGGRTNRLARVYRGLGVTPDSLVTIGLPNGIGFVETTVAAWKLGRLRSRSPRGCPQRSAAPSSTSPTPRS